MGDANLTLARLLAAAYKAPEPDPNAVVALLIHPDDVAAFRAAEQHVASQSPAPLGSLRLIETTAQPRGVVRKLTRAQWEALHAPLTFPVPRDVP
jgi:hypothetical protein